MAIDQQDNRIAPDRPQLRHVLEVHAVDPGDGGRHGEDGGPAGELAHHLALSICGKQQVRIERPLQHLSQNVDALVDADDVVVHVRVVRADLLVDERHAEPLQPIADLHQRRRGVPQPQQVAAQGGDAPDGLRAERAGTCCTASSISSTCRSIASTIGM